MTFRRDLQGLRAVAVLLVIIAHSELGILEGGFVGVDVFFVLSGYLITGMLISELILSQRISLARFYSHRLKRLLPALVVMVVVISVASLFVLSNYEMGKQLASAPYVLSWVSNIYFFLVEIEYFDELSSKDLFLHTWSLGVEEQFYLVWPLMLFVLYKVSNLFVFRFTGRLYIIFISLILIFFISLCLSAFWTSVNPRFAFYSMFSRAWQFSLGGIGYFVVRKGIYVPSSFRKLSALVPLTGLVLVVGSALVLHPRLQYPGFWALLPSFGAFLVIVSPSLPSYRSFSLLDHPVFVWLGNVSYSLYLWHWPIFILGFSLGLGGGIVSTAGLIVLIFLLAGISYRYIELPFWKGRFSEVDSKVSLLISLVIMAGMIAVANFGLRQLTMAHSMNDVSSSWRNDVPTLYKLSCDTWVSDSAVEPCIFGASTAEKTVVLLGDSIGIQWFSVVQAIFKEPEWRVVVITKSSCPMIDEDYFYQFIGKVFTVCSEWRASVLDELDRLKPDIVVMGSAGAYGFNEKQWVEGSSRIFKRVGSAAGFVLVIPPTPTLGFDGPGCVLRHLSRSGKINSNRCLAKGRLKHVDAIGGFLSSSARHFSNIFVLNLNDLVCPEKICRAATADGAVVFRDSQHLTNSFVKSKVSIVSRRIDEMLGNGSPDIITGP
ncbi:MAG: acyltransferase [Gammaproteobacteria bacterium]|nr:acyltransferase [Gammaproteobacteria bacterium]